MALPTHLTLEIVTPERPLVRETVDEVELPGVEGELGILPGHTPLLTVLKVGRPLLPEGRRRSYVAIAHGFAEVLPDRVTVLARMAERAEEIDVTKARGGPGAGRAAPRRRRPADSTSRRAREALAKASTRACGRIEGPDQIDSAVLMRVQWAATTHPGIRRTSNEDTYCSRPDLGLFIVADGMGGHVAGEVASRSRSTRSRRSSARPRARTRQLTWPHPIDPTLGSTAAASRAPSTSPTGASPTKWPAAWTCAAWRPRRRRCC